MRIKPTTFEERRPTTRVAVDLHANYAADGQEFRPTRVREISTSGMRMITSAPLPPASLIDIDVAFERDRSVRIKVQVVRLVASDERVFDYGVKVVSDNIMKGALRAAVLEISLKKAPKLASGALTYVSTRHFQTGPKG